MAHHFNKHYTLEEARALLPQIREWLASISVLRVRIEQYDKAGEGHLASGCDAGGDDVNRWITAVAELKQVLTEFQSREIQIKDMERGLIDFPAIIAGKEVFLCWEKAEDDIEYWHDLDSGYTGREAL